MRKFLGYKIVDRHYGSTPDELDEQHLITGMRRLDSFFRFHEYEQQWIIVPVYVDSDNEPYDYKIMDDNDFDEAPGGKDPFGRTLLGYQVISHDDDMPPEEFAPDEVITHIKLLNAFFSSHSAEEHHWIIVPVYKGDIENPIVLTEEGESDNGHPDIPSN